MGRPWLHRVGILGEIEQVDRKEIRWPVASLSENHFRKQVSYRLRTEMFEYVLLQFVAFRGE